MPPLSPPMPPAPQPAPPLLSLRPFQEADRAPLEALLAQPELLLHRPFARMRARMQLAWHRSCRTFSVRSGERLVGLAKLSQDHREPHLWALTLCLEDHGRRGDGARCAALLISYAFQRPEMQILCFLSALDDEPVRHFAERFGFHQLCQLQAPGGQSSAYYELHREAWLARREAIFAQYFGEAPLDERVRFFDGHQRLYVSPQGVLTVAPQS